MIRVNCLVFTIAFIFFISLPNSGSAQQAEEIFNKVERNIQNIDLLSFNSQVTSINPTQTDSISKFSAKIWLKRVPTDSIFQAHLHLQGKDINGRFEYFYDGQNSYEIRPENKKVTIFHPHNYPNNANNPAKTRTALIPFNNLLISKDFTARILGEEPNISVYKTNTQKKWILTVDYPENQYGQDVTKTFEISKSGFLVKRIIKEVNWRGVTYSTTYHFNNYKKRDRSIANNIYISKDYEKYSQVTFGRDNVKEQKTYKELLGKPAPKFSFESLSGSNISLDKYRGQIVLLDFWETWCGYCIMAMPKLNKLQREYKSEVKVIGITTQNKNQVKKLIQKNDLVYSNIYADQSILEDYNISNRPTYILIDRNQNITSINYGNLGEIETKVENLLN